MTQKTQQLIDLYVEAHAECRWMDAGDLEVLLTEFAGKIEEGNERFRTDVREMRKAQKAYFLSRRNGQNMDQWPRLLAESRSLEKRVDEQLKNEPSLFDL